MPILQKFLLNKMAVNSTIIILLLFIALFSLVAAFRPVCTSFPSKSETSFEPCMKNDILCIRAALNCELPAPRAGPNANLDEMLLHLPYFNLTITQAPLMSGLITGNIDLFSIDYIRRKINLNLSFSDVWINGSSEIHHFPTGIVTNTYMSEYYESIKLTVEFSSSKSLNLEHGNVYTQFSAPAVYDFGDCLQNNPDPQLVSLINEILKNKWIAAAEGFVVRSMQIVENFIDNVLCDI